MMQSPRRPPNYPTSGFVPPTPPTPSSSAAPMSRTPATSQPAASRAASPPAPPVAGHGRRDVVVRSNGIKLLSILGILHASIVLMALVVVLVMALGGDARIGLVITTIKNASTLLWTWTLFAFFTSFVLGFVMLYNAIALLSLTPWSARAMKLWSGVWLGLSAIAIIVNLAWIYPLLREASPD